MKEEKNAEIFLRPRFQVEISQASASILQEFTRVLKEEPCQYPSRFSDGHVSIDVPVKDAHFWSPQLSIEVVPLSDSTSLIKGLFGPKPQVWTLFMFVHFVLSVLFLGLGVVLYSQIRLGHSHTLSLILVISIPIVWMALYFLGRIGKSTGRPQMEELHCLFLKIIENP